jgi:predicted TIM-barrel fold metal-dependent hydrolase
MPVVDATLDLDGHEMAPVHLWGDLFGEASGRIAEMMTPMLKKAGHNDFYSPSRNVDDVEITYDTVWKMKGTSAPGAFDFSRRPAVLDALGVEKQLIFPSAAIGAMQMLDRVNTPWIVGSDASAMSIEDMRELGRRGIEEYHLWAAQAQSVDPDRIRMVGYLSPAETVDELLADAQKLIGMRFKALHINAGTPPAQKSPADPELDRLWALLEKNRVPLVVHVGSSEIGFLASPTWSKAPAFAPGKVVSHELGIEPYSFVTLNYPISNFLLCLTLGGVFERFPGLVFGAIEVGASWFGPFVESLDMWADVYAARLEPFISSRPSEYMRRNVRVTPFNNFEPVSEHLTRYPHLQDCYAFSTDYPHFEGGLDIQRALERKLSAIDDEVQAKFFRHNGELLFQ